MRVDLLRDPHALRRVAVDAVCDQRTVARFLQGFPVLSTTRVRLERALQHLDLGTARRVAARQKRGTLAPPLGSPASTREELRARQRRDVAGGDSAGAVVTPAVGTE